MIARGTYEYSDTHSAKIHRLKGDIYLGRRVVAQDMDIRGAVNYELVSKETLVVDYDEHPEIYQEYCDEALQYIQCDESQQVPFQQALHAAFTTVFARISPSREGVERIHRNAENPRRPYVELSTFMQEGVGVCRHQTLVCAALLEQLKDGGWIDGSISVEKSERTNTSTGEGVGHSWVRFTSQSGANWVIDVAGGYSGPLKVSEKKVDWDYRRPEERAMAKLGSVATSGVLGLRRFSEAFNK